MNPKIAGYGPVQGIRVRLRDDVMPARLRPQHQMRPVVSTGGGLREQTFHVDDGIAGIVRWLILLDHVTEKVDGGERFLFLRDHVLLLLILRGLQSEVHLLRALENDAGEKMLGYFVLAV